ncbi:hypothetical protein GO491_01310 [Flavobacteriaceae bacterium Ap0902]|nr:hypothetical protein [Flavobacteriaceae bacterium Ap0902]
MENYTIGPQISETVIQDRLNSGYNFDIGNYISTGWEIFKKEWVTFSLYGLIMLVIVMTGIGALFTGALIIGFFIGADKVVKGEKLSLNDMFGGFNKNLGSLIVLMLIPIVIMGAIYSLFFGVLIGTSSFAPNDDAAAMAAMGSMLIIYLLMFVIGMALSLAMFFAPYLVYFGDYAVIDAIKTSWKLSMKNVLMILLFTILIGFITQVGIFVCLIGIVVSMAFAYVCYYPLMKDVLFDQKITPEQISSRVF